MASSSISFCQMNVQQHRKPKPFPIERRPKLLKDFLNDNSNSCSSSGFKSFPRHQPFNLPKFNSKTVNSKPKAASTTISALQAVINAVKNIPFTTVKSPSFLPRSLSRRLSRRDSTRPKRPEQEKENEVKISVKVKDILRWTSFRDLVEEISPPLDFPTSPHPTTSTTTGSIDSSFNSNGSSWSESDYTEEFLPSWTGNCGEKEHEMGKKGFNCVGLDSVEATTETETETANYTARDPQDGEMLLYEEDEQQSPVSVFDFRFKDNEERFSTFDQSLANVERTRQNLIQNIKRFESLANLEPLNSDEFMSTEEVEEEEEDNDDYEEYEYGLVEERARELLDYVKETSSSHSSNAEEDQLLLDFFREEMRALKSHETKYDEYNWEMVSLAKAWLSGEQKAVLGWGLDHNREVYIREMHKEGRWSQFEVEQEELALEIEAGMLGQLIDEVLVDIFSK